MIKAMLFTLVAKVGLFGTVSTDKSYIQVDSLDQCISYLDKQEIKYSGIQDVDILRVENGLKVALDYEVHVWRCDVKET